MLTCTKCNQDLPETSFHKATNESRGYKWYCKECVSAEAREYRLNNPEMRARKAENLRKWRRKNKHRSAYLDQKNNASSRGVEFLFSYDEWLEWWGDDVDLRGCRLGQLVMARNGDIGPYHPDNCHKVTCSENQAEYWGRLQAG